MLIIHNSRTNIKDTEKRYIKNFSLNAILKNTEQVTDQLNIHYIVLLSIYTDWLKCLARLLHC